MIFQRTRWAALFVAAAFARPGPASAQAPAAAPHPLDLQAAIRLALEQPALRAARHEVEASEALVEQAGRLPNPELAYLREGGDAGARTTTIQVSQPVELGGKRAARIASAQGAAGLARSEWLARRQDVRADVIAAYHDVLAGRRRRALAEELAALARRSVDVAARRVAAGKASPIDATRARLAAADAATALSQAKAALEIAGMRLGALLGRPDDGIVRADGLANELANELADGLDALPDVPSLATLLAQAGRSAPVQAARSELAAREAQARVERAARVPDLTVTVGTQREEQTRGGQAAPRQAVFGLSVPLPLFDRNDGRLRAALQRTGKAREALAAAGTAVAADLAAARTRYATARDEAALLARDVVPDANDAFELTLKGFEYGKFSILDVLDAQRTWFQARSRQCDSLLAAWRAYADIERLAPTGEPDN